jgi:hypothetical protein
MTTPVYYRGGSVSPAWGSWAIKPRLCGKCGARRAVTWTAAVDLPDGAWSSTCPRCLPLGPRVCLTERETQKKHDVTAMIREVTAIPSPDGLNLEMWLGEKFEVNANKLSAITGSFADLGPARIRAIERAQTPPWALFREDDRVWAPRDPTYGVSFRAVALPLRQTTIGKRRISAKCYGCKAEITEGSSAWMPDTGDRRKWSSRGLSIRFCVPCVHVVPERTDGEPDGGEQVGHLRVFTGERESSGVQS